MKLARILLPTVAAAALLAPAAHADPRPVDTSRLISTDQTVSLEANATRDIVVPIQGLGQASNVLTPCFGFEIKGPGVDLAGADLEFFGVTTPEDPSKPDGGIPGAQRDAAGNFVVPETAAVLTADVLRMGTNCRSVGWDFYGSDGEPTLDAYGNPNPSSTPASASKAKAASKRKRDQARKRMSRKIVGRAAAQGPVTVSLAGITTRADRTAAMVLRVTTRELAGATTVSLHARVLRQG
jgi:hypothetical protein